MSIDELEASYSQRGLERTPPQNLDAEQSVLGAMMLSKDAMADVIESVRADDFYRPAHETIFDTAITLYNSGDPVDALTVGAERQRSGELARVGGAEYLHTLISIVPSAASAGYYARLVREQSILRRLVEAGTRIANMGYDADGAQVDDV
ncbi:MAG TPA: DnaB-like helicase N-terminal domain-containing protein, partial [Demequina sp.]|nr:DnaB-like helicase N-terminal domain-containing protein [Demequina sp.]